MLSARDRKFYQSLADQRAVSGFSPPTDVESYRAMFGPVEAAMNAEPMPTIGGYHAAVEIAPGLTTAVAVPDGPGPFPVLIHCHGNGGLAGSAESYRRFSYDCAVRGFLTFTPDYRLAPEHIFPAGFDDMVQAVRWVADSAGAFEGDSTKLCISGNSTGAGMAVSVTRELLCSGSPLRIRAVVGVDGRYDRISDQTPGLEWMLQAYLGSDSPTLALDPRVSPGQGLKAGMLPRTLLIGGSADHTAPSTVTFAHQLLKAGIPFQMNIFEGTGHDFMRWPNLDVSREGFDVMFTFLTACAQQEV